MGRDGWKELAGAILYRRSRPRPRQGAVRAPADRYVSTGALPVHSAVAPLEPGLLRGESSAGQSASGCRGSTGRARTEERMSEPPHATEVCLTPVHEGGIVPVRILPY